MDPVISHLLAMLIGISIGLALATMVMVRTKRS